MPQEKQIENAIKTLIKYSPNSFCLKYHGSSTTGQGIPDLWGSYYGVPFAVEIKAPGGVTAIAQVRWVKRLQAGGYVSGVVSSIQEFEDLFQCN